MYLGVHTPKDVLVSLAIGAILILVCYPLVERSKENPIYMYCIIAFAFLLTLGNLLFVMLYPFPADVDLVNLEDARENAWKLMAIIVGTVFLYPIEHKWIKFETKAVWWAQILKLLGGVIILLGVRIVLKAPFNALFGVYVGGALRYFLMLIAGGLLWPITFKWFAKLGQPKESIEK
jgi:undecaprenyl-diphosphatase